MNIDRCPCVSVIPSCIGGSLTTSGESSGGGVSAWLRCASWHVSNQHGEQNFCHFDRSVCKHAALASVWLSNPGCTAWIGLQKCHLWQAGSSKKTAGSVQKTPSGKHHLGTWSIITPGSRVTDTCTFSQTCNYIRNMWADSSTPHCFHVFLFFFFFPKLRINPCHRLIGRPFDWSAWPFVGSSLRRTRRAILPPLPQENPILYLPG